MDDTFSIKVEDLVQHPSHPVEHILHLSKGGTVKQLREKCSEVTGYPSNSFDIVHQNSLLLDSESLDVIKFQLQIVKKPGANLPSKAVNSASKEEKKLESAMASLSVKESSEKVCGICMVNEELENIGCSHQFCKECLSRFLSSEFNEKRKSFLDIICPGLKCNNRLSQEIFKKYANEDTRKSYESVLKTIPENPSDPNLSIDDFYYTYNDKGILVHKETGNRFHWVNQVHYDLLGDLIVPYIQKRMISEFNMIEKKLPEENCQNLPPHVRNNIFITPDALTNPNKLMLLIQGSGAVRAGQWARALCINDTLNTGTILPYLKKAIGSGYGVIVFNPNLNRVPENPLIRPSRDELFIPGKPTPKEVPTIRIPFNEDPVAHTVYVWDQFVEKSKAAEIVIVAHSAGGSCTMNLLRQREMNVLSRLKGIAFTDSVHSVSIRESENVKKFLLKNAVNWVQSDKPLDTPMPSHSPNDCTCVSAGHTKHEHTSQSAIESVFKFLNSKVSS